MDSSSDAALVHLARAGNPDAYNELIRRYQNQVWALACVLVEDRFEAEDLAQEAFLRAWLNLDLLSDPAKFAPWLRRILFGVTIDWLRAFRPDLYRLHDSQLDLELSGQPAATESPLARLEAIELRQRISEALARLPKRYRLPLTMFHLDGLSHGKVAEALGVPVSTVRSLVTRARQKMHPMLAAYAAGLLPALEDVLQEQAIGSSGMLHITDGESVAGTLRDAGLPGTVSIYGDLMYEGPAPAALDDEAWRKVRGRFLAEAGYAPLDEALRYLKACDDALAAFPGYEEVVIWLDHRLSDQLILIRVLDWFSRRDLGRVKVGLICVGQYPGMEHFVGLGQLSADQLASLADTRLRITEEQFVLARTAWEAFTAPDPRAIEHVIAMDTSALPFVAAAFRRHLEQFPSVDGGLSRTERQALSILLELGPLPGGRLFAAVQRLEEQIFMGDSSFYRMMASLATVRYPLVHVSDSPDARLGIVALTETGRRVIEGRADHVEINGIDRWLGGVHLIGDRAAWRWDRMSGRLVQGF